MITKDDLKHLSKLSKIDLSEDEYKTYVIQIEKIVKYLDKLDEITLDQTELYPITKKISELRDDEAREYNTDISNVIKNKKNRYVNGPRMN
jgi:aspartyl-tRNA(Asn)/glutamyl-tRNA(Gln) amidotransferase subunit C